MRLVPRRLHHRPAPAMPATGSSARGSRGQSLVEFSLVLAPLMLLLLGIIQFGFIFHTYVSLANGAREAAREGSIYLYDRNLTRSANDLARNNRVRTVLLASLNGLGTSAPHLATGTTWTSTTSGSTVTFTNGDLVVSYTQPSGVTNNDPRRGWRLSVRVTYHQDLFVPIIPAFLPQDADGRLPLTGDVTMVIN